MTKKRDLVVGNTTYCKCFDKLVLNCSCNSIAIKHDMQVENVIEQDICVFCRFMDT